jgi:hypothetical protein
MSSANHAEQSLRLAIELTRSQCETIVDARESVDLLATMLCAFASAIHGLAEDDELPADEAHLFVEAAEAAVKAAEREQRRWSKIERVAVGSPAYAMSVVEMASSKECGA